MKWYWKVVCSTCGFESELFPDTSRGYASAVSVESSHIEETREKDLETGAMYEHITHLDKVRKEED